ncbi:MAG: cupredoxin domain-containing protein [Actinobacteria bacterium]|nr:cupredoxin domain-containing protein [Actinomycetota bacterium]
MRKLFTAVAAGAVLALGAAGQGAAWADHSMDSTTGVTCSPSGTSLALTAEGHKFDKDCLAVPAGESFTISFDNRDDDRHNLAILPSHTATETLFQGDIIPGPKSTVYAVPNMKAGTYHFHCEVHPNLMNGTFIVAASDAAAPAPMPAPSMGTGNGKTSDAMPAEPSKATPAPAAKPAPAAPAAKPAVPAAKPAPAATPVPDRPADARASAPTAAGAAADSKLPHTGPVSTNLLLLAGLALAAGGLAVLGGARGDTARS